MKSLWWPREGARTLFWLLWLSCDSTSYGIRCRCTVAKCHCGRSSSFVCVHDFFDVTASWLTPTGQCRDVIAFTAGMRRHSCVSKMTSIPPTCGCGSALQVRNWSLLTSSRCPESVLISKTSKRIRNALFFFFLPTQPNTSDDSSTDKKNKYTF